MNAIGTDIYLRWNDMTRRDRDAQITGFSIHHGHAGYLRASIHMDAEHIVLRQLFPETYWRTITPDGMPYDFHEHAPLVEPVLALYETGMVIGHDALFDNIKELAASIEALVAGPGVTLVKGTNNERRDRRVWSESLRGFYALGTRLQDEKRAPRVLIDW